MDEGRKRVLLIAAAILAVEKAITYDAGRVPATIYAISDAVWWAEELLTGIDRRRLKGDKKEHGENKSIRSELTSPCGDDCGAN